MTTIHTSRAPHVLATHRHNLDTRAAIQRRWGDTFAPTGHTPAIIWHPTGALVTGIHPAGPVPRGWVMDHSRGILIPDVTTPAGRAISVQLADLEWVRLPLPGLHLPDGTHPPLPHLEPDGLDLADPSTCGVLEVAGALWCLTPQGYADMADPRIWQRSRRYLLEEALGAVAVP